MAHHDEIMTGTKKQQQKIETERETLTHCQHFFPNKSLPKEGGAGVVGAWEGWDGEGGDLSTSQERYQRACNK